MEKFNRLGKNIYLLDYDWEYDTEGLMQCGASSALRLLRYAGRQARGVKLGLGKMDFGCSAFQLKNERGEACMGRNFDYMDAPCYVVWTHPKGGYASISTVDANFMLTFDKYRPRSRMGRRQLLKAPYFPMDGMNEKGLSIAVLQIHADATKQDTGRVKLFPTALIRCCLDTCADVDEAIAFFGRFDVRDAVLLGYSLGCCFHYMLCDAKGNAAVIEYVRGEMRVIHPQNAPFCVTNFFLSPDGGEGMEKYDPEGMERSEVMEKTLSDNGGVLDLGESFQLLSDVHLNYRHKNNLYDITTLWSCLFNNEQKTVAFAARMDYSDIYTFSVTEPMKVLSKFGIEPRTPGEGRGYL